MKDELVERLRAGRSRGDMAHIAAANEAADRIESLEAKLEKAREGLSITGAWLDRWAVHVGSCAGSQACSCGLTNARYEAAVALQEIAQ